jgi:putative endonuclease
MQQRQIRGSVAYHSGRAAEGAVTRHYQDTGHSVLSERWRGPFGEIDLILRDKDELVFVEVKKARSHAQAAERVTPRQVGRILRSASDYLRGEPAGQMTPCRVDVALVDVFGRVEILHNALAA